MVGVTTRGNVLEFAHLFPSDVVVASVRAPYPQSGGYAWFPSQGNPMGDPQPRVANAAAEGVLDWLDTPAVRVVDRSSRLLQGGAMVLQLMRHAPERFAYGVQLAGFLVKRLSIGRRGAGPCPSTRILGRGALDTVIPRQSIGRTQCWMETHTRPEGVVYRGLGHEIAGAEVTDFARSLRGSRAAGERHEDMTHDHHP